ncbi:hypothetical protein G6F59_014475 [Rhizopus arrhizus]|nr:hypothetical protein G6F59_014475 [Rhizopus arrhizus]
MATIGTSTSSRAPAMIAVSAQPDSCFFGAGTTPAGALVAYGVEGGSTGGCGGGGATGRVRRRRYATAAIAAGRRATPGCPGRSGCCGTTQPTVPPAAGPGAGCLLRGTTRSRGRS